MMSVCHRGSASIVALLMVFAVGATFSTISAITMSRWRTLSQMQAEAQVCSFADGGFLLPVGEKIITQDGWVVQRVSADRVEVKGLHWQGALTRTDESILYQTERNND